MEMSNSVLKASKASGITLAVSLELHPWQKAAISAVAQQGFVLGFRIVMMICAGLSFLSAAIAFLMVPDLKVHCNLTAKLQGLSDVPTCRTDWQA